MSALTCTITILTERADARDTETYTATNCRLNNSKEKHKHASKQTNLRLKQ